VIFMSLNTTSHRLKSHELLQHVLQPHMKEFDATTKPARSTVYQWTRPPPPKGTGSRNPLDGVESLMQFADAQGKTEIAQWVCLAAHGFFIPGANPEHHDNPQLLRHSTQLIQEFAKMIETLAETARDGKIEPHEARDIRKAWQRIQSTTEFYVRECESGRFDVRRAVEQNKIQTQKPITDLQSASKSQDKVPGRGPRSSRL
jgi:hypothetical protein